LNEIRNKLNPVPAVEPKKKPRNYSFKKSRKLSPDKMTEVNGIKIPSMPGSCYHAIIATLAENKDKFCSWAKIIEGTQKYMRMYGGSKAWETFVSKDEVKTYEQRIQDNTHTLTRGGKDCYGFRLHELGMCIYYFKDGAVLYTNGEMKINGKYYDVVFPNGLKLQTRYRGTGMTYREYGKFLEKGYIDKTGRILNENGIKYLRRFGLESIDGLPFQEDILNVCVELQETFDQKTALRLEKIGFIVEQGFDNELIGTIIKSKLAKLKADKDVKEVTVAGE
jgi:hypothetical protein